MDDQSIFNELEYTYSIDELWANVKQIKDDKQFAKAVLALEAAHPTIHTRACYDKHNEFIERMFMKQVANA